MPLHVLPKPLSPALSPIAVAVRTKAQTLDQLGCQRALKCLNAMADHALLVAQARLRTHPDTTAAATRARTIATLRAAGAELCVAYLERQGAAN